jgi:predicted metalloprotease with PDZ domain
VRYVVHADELSVRTSHVDASHAALNGASTFLMLRGAEHLPHTVAIHAPDGWRTTVALPEGEPGMWRAASYDELVDSPFEIGTHALWEWETEGRRHRWAIWGRGNYDVQRLTFDTSRIVAAEKALWGELPYGAFTFILHLTPGGSGGLEHRDSTLLQADRWSFRGPSYEHFLALTAHELFHAWNGKRLRPEGLGPFDLTREAYTRELWVVEGITTYYTDVVLRRAGIITAQRYLERLAESVTRLFGVPGRFVQPLADASFDTWIKFYRPDANSPNATISYYLKGSVVAMLLDLRIRQATVNARALDDVMRAMWERFGAADLPFPAGEVERVAAEVAGADLSAFFDAALRGRGELDYASGLAAAGLELVQGAAPAAAPAAATVGEPGARPAPHDARTGIQMKFENGRTVVGNVLADTPAWRAGLNAGDEVIALDGIRVGLDSLTARLMDRKPGERVTLTVFRRDELMNLPLQVEHGPPQRWEIRPLAGATPEQVALREDWLRAVVTAPAAAGAG